jgi:predicted nucleotidyltransferase
MGSIDATTGIATGLLGKVRAAVLALLFAHPDEAYYLRQVVRETGLGHGAVQRELPRLVKLGLVTRDKRGREVFYQANQRSPLFPELRGLIIKTAGVAEALREALVGVDGIQLAFVFGSLAKGTFDSRSDADVMIVGNASFGDISAALMAAESRLHREVTPTVYTAEEFRQKLAEGHPFLARVLSEPKIMLVGDEDDLERLGRSTP